MTEQKFWELIEISWSDFPELDTIRKEALISNEASVLTELGNDLSETVTDGFMKRLSKLNKEELAKFIHILEEKLFKIDRQDIHKFTEGGDDGFLYSRCFIVGMGEEYYTMIDKNPSKAVFDAEAEIFGLAAYEVYRKKFGERFEMNSVHCIETGSNKAAWDF